MNRKARRAAAKIEQTAGRAGATAAAAVPFAAGELFGAGIKHHQAGRTAEAAACYRSVLAIEPRHAEALHLLGVLAQESGRHDLAVELFRLAIKENARNPLYFSNLGVALKDQGKPEEAVAAYRQAIALKPDLAEAHSNLGNALNDLGQHDEAAAAHRRAVALKPDHAEAYSNLGNALYELGKYDEAAAAHRRAIALRPDYAGAHSNLGNALKELGELDEAVAAHRRAIALKPDHAEAHCNLATVLCEQGMLDEAVGSYRHAIAIRPDLTEAHFNLGVALYDQGKLDDAADAYRAAIALAPDHAAAHCNLGNTLAEQAMLEPAVAAYRQALGIRHDYADAHYNLANALNDQGRLEAAMAAYRQAIGMKPEFAVAHSNLLFCMNGSDALSRDDLFAAHREWDERHARPAPRATPHANDRVPERRLRIGYVSPDFRKHSVTYFFEPLLREHDRQTVEVFCYAAVKRPDAVTARLQGLADHWIATVGMPDDALAERIRNDRIDILVDLAGHTGGNRLMVFARKPAPIQVTWLGYPNTTGLGAIDYRLVDAVTDPVGEADRWASETLLLLDDGFLCYNAPPDAPERAAPPGRDTGAVTFGSFNNPSKLSPATLDAWATLLARLPRARLLLKGKQFADPATRDLLLARLARRGIAAERIELAQWVPGSAAHLSFYDRIDIALDPFPYNGTTTTCEALWMGVPVVTLQGHRHAGRVGASLLTRVDLTDCIAKSREHYVEIACALAGDPDRLASLRRGLRPRMASSSLCDGRAFARQMEGAFRGIWRQWCAAPTSAAAAPGTHAEVGGWPERSALPLRLGDGPIIAVPPNLSAITTYVLLEQEDWFEKEIHFLRRFVEPGTTAIDIGANLGICSLTLARLVGPGGRVFAYEPGSEARRLLTHSRALNDLGNLEIVDAAVSDGERQGHLAFAASSELRALGSAGAGEAVRITSLDAEGTMRGWPAVDFIKIDAEGEEERIIAGGREFFSTHSPLVMFEVKAESRVNNRLPAIFHDMGYRVFRLLAGAPMLVPHDVTQPLDQYELNLFAAKPDRIDDLAKRGFLVEIIPSWAPSDPNRHHALGFWRLQEFGLKLTASGVTAEPRDPDYRDALAAYATWRSLDRPAATRCAALLFALQSLRSLCARAPTAERLSSFARVAWEWGARSESVAALQQLLPMTQTAPVVLSEPLWPASPRFDDIAPGTDPAHWLAAAAAEQFERSFAFSSAFGGASPHLDWISQQEFASAEMERRRTLLAARGGLQPTVPDRLRILAHDHLNADIWRGGLVPGTVLGITESVPEH
jgi:FkbM family methyltransferase